MAYDYAERLYDFPTTLRLSPERLYDFPARVCDFDRAADLPTGSAAFSFPSNRRRVPPGRRGRCRGSGLIWAAFFAFYMYSTFSFKFSDGGKHQEKT